jgi:hypothetical protein
MPTPQEWAARLDKRLGDRLPQVKLYNDYYDGDQRLQFASEQFRKAFGGLFDEFADNWCAPVVNAVDERLQVVGFRFGDDPQADTDAWRIWQANHMDAESRLAIKAALIDSESFLLVWPTDDETTPSITVESADQMVVACEPGSRYKRAAAWKRYTDEWTGEEHGVLYLPDGVYKYKKAANDQKAKSTATLAVFGSTQNKSEWVPRYVTGEEWPLPNPFGEVPVVPLRNDPRLRFGCRSELRSVIPLQDAINKILSDAMVASEFGAFRQKWATGIDIPVDPETNQPIEAWQMAVSRFITSPPAELGDEAARFGDFNSTDMANFTGFIDMLVMHVASHTRTPPHYLNASADRLSGESIKAAETGLVSKARERMLHFGEGLEEALRLCFRLQDDPRADFVGAETIWNDPETRTEAEHVDAVGKKRTLLDVPRRQSWEDAGYSPQQMARMEADLVAEQQLGGTPEDARDIAELLQKIYLAVTAGVISADEAREIANRAGAGLIGPAPEKPAPAPFGGFGG